MLLLPLQLSQLAKQARLLFSRDRLPVLLVTCSCSVIKEAGGGGCAALLLMLLLLLLLPHPTPPAPPPPARLRLRLLQLLCAAHALGASPLSWSCISLVHRVRLSRSSCMMRALSL